MSARAGFLVVVAAPSGTGKTTVCRKVVACDERLVFSVSHTTRPRREGETEGADYHFVSGAEFAAMVSAEQFLEYASYNDNLYGTSWQAIDAPLAEGFDVLLEIEVQGARQVRAQRPDARFIFLLPPSLGELRRRLTARGTDDPEAIERRLALAQVELGSAPDFDYALVNDDVEVCAERLEEVLQAERRGEVTLLRERHAPRPALERFRSAAAR